MARYAWSHDNYRPAMSFEDIGAELGMTKQRVFDEYQRALRKLRESPEIAEWFVAVNGTSSFAVRLPRRRYVVNA